MKTVKGARLEQHGIKGQMRRIRKISSSVGCSTKRTLQELLEAEGKEKSLEEQLKEQNLVKKKARTQVIRFSAVDRILEKKMFRRKRTINKKKDLCDEYEEDIVLIKKRACRGYRGSHVVRKARSLKEKVERDSDPRIFSSYVSSSPSSPSSSPSSSVTVLNGYGSNAHRYASWQEKDLFQKRRKKQKGIRCCHQCKRKDRLMFIPCYKCKEKLYCLQCIKKWYPQMSSKEVAENCPFCRGNCNCTACLHISGNLKISQREMTHQKAHRTQYLIHCLLPFLKKIHSEQYKEMKIEARIQGLTLSEIELPLANCRNDERVYCDNCATSIADLHRSCPNCSYELCLSCCRELREENLLGGPQEVFIHYPNRGSPP